MKAKGQTHAKRTVARPTKTQGRGAGKLTRKGATVVPKRTARVRTARVAAHRAEGKPRNHNNNFNTRKRRTPAKAEQSQHGYMNFLTDEPTSSWTNTSRVVQPGTFRGRDAGAVSRRRRSARDRSDMRLVLYIGLLVGFIVGRLVS